MANTITSCSTEGCITPAIFLVNTTEPLCAAHYPHLEPQPYDWRWGPLYANASNDIAAEARRARLKWPSFNSSHEGYAVIAEEVDELWDDIKANNLEHSIEEAIQVGAMALRYVADMRAKLAERQT